MNRYETYVREECKKLKTTKYGINIKTELMVRINLQITWN